MTTTFQSNDQRRLVKILGLNRDQRLPGSLLKSLMDDAERAEAQGAVGLVEDILELMDAIEEADRVRYGTSSEAAQPIQSDFPDGLERIDVRGEILTVFQPGSSAADGAAKVRAANVARLKQLLDPHFQLGGVTEGGLLLW